MRRLSAGVWLLIAAAAYLGLVIATHVLELL